MTVAGRDDRRRASPRTVTSCEMCLAWGLIYASRICLDCYNFTAKARQRPIGCCGACHRVQVLKNGYCRLCWCQAREDRMVAGGDARSLVMIAPHLPKVRAQQLFFAGMHGKHVPPPRTAPRRWGEKGRPLKPGPPPASRPSTAWCQPPLFDHVIARVYRYGQIDLRTGPVPDNPWLAWALHLAHTIAEARGWEPTVRRGMQRTLVMLLASYVHGDRLRVSDFQQTVIARCTNLDNLVEILTSMDVVDDDRPREVDRWADARLSAIAPAIGRDTEAWLRALVGGEPRMRARSPATAYTYLRAIHPALVHWSATYDHLREVTRDDVVAFMAGESGYLRRDSLAGLKSLFGWARRHKLVFRNPTYRVRYPAKEHPIWQPLTQDDIDQAITAATTTAVKVFVVLAAIHAGRPGQIRALQLDHVDLTQRRITIAGHDRPLDELTFRILTDWLAERRRRWPNTANPHLVISRESALGHGPVSVTFAGLALRGLRATVEKLRIDRQLDEAVVTGADPLHLAEVFGIADSTAVRYANNARILLREFGA